MHHDRLFVVVNSGLVAILSGALTAQSHADCHSITLPDCDFDAAWAGRRLDRALGENGVSPIDTSTWTVHMITVGVNGAVLSRYGIAAWSRAPQRPSACTT